GQLLDQISHSAQRPLSLINGPLPPPPRRPPARRLQPQRMSPLDIGAPSFPRSLQARSPHQRRASPIIAPTMHSAAPAASHRILLAKTAVSRPSAAYQPHPVPSAVASTNFKLKQQI